MDIIAERHLMTLFPDGEMVPVCLRIGRPVPHPKGDYACPVQAKGLRLWEGSAEVVGIDAWQALLLGISLLHSMMAAEAERGAVFHWEDGKYAVSIEELFPRKFSPGPRSSGDGTEETV